MFSPKEVSSFIIAFQFRDMIDGLRMDATQSQYKNFEEIHLYYYHMAGTVALTSVPITGCTRDSAVPAQSVYNVALYLGLTEKDVLSRKVTEKWGVYETADYKGKILVQLG
ncbi:Phytoene synthase 1 [Spatholobus suberectus]|nr:Phytoene synthase 1 [Spatholobus suberectus]